MDGMKLGSDRFPSLEELAIDPAKAMHLPPEIAKDLLAKTVAIQTALLAALSSWSVRESASGAKRFSSTWKEAAKRLATSTDWLYRNAGRHPFTVRISPGRIRFSSIGIDRYVRERQGHG